MRELLRFYFKFIIWCFRWAIVLWFLALPCIMVFGFLKPWEQGAQALRAEGISGVLLLFGGASSYSSSGGVWEKSQQRSYIVVPDSFRKMEIFTCTVTETNATPAQFTVERSRILLVLLLLYIGAGVHTFLVFRQLARRRRVRLVQEG